MARLAWTTKITALCEVSSCVNSSVFVFLAPARIIFSIFWDEKQEISLVWPSLKTSEATTPTLGVRSLSLGSRDDIVWTLDWTMDWTMDWNMDS